MKLDGEYLFDNSVQDVWDALFDPAVLAAVMPGCEKLDLVDGSYVGEIKVKVGPIQGKFTGKVDLRDIVELKSYRMLVDGRGAQGFVKANAEIKLSAEGGKTKVVYTSEAQVGGKIATVGQRLVETSAKAIVKESLEGLAENIRIRAEAYRAHAIANAPPLPPTELDVPAFKMPTPGTASVSAAAATGLATAPAAGAGLAPAQAAATARLVASTEAATATDAPSPAAETAASVANAIAAATETVAAAAPPSVAAPAVPTLADKLAAAGAAAAASSTQAASSAVKPASSVAVAAAPKPAGPIVEYKRADPKKLAGVVAKEVGKTLAPIIILVVVVIAAVIYLLVR